MKIITACITGCLLFSPLAALAQELPPALPEVEAEVSEQIQLPFTDIAADSPYLEALTYLKENQLIEGLLDGSFKPDRPATRLEALSMILSVTQPAFYVRYKNPETTTALELTMNRKKPFVDVKKSDWYFALVTAAKDEGFVTGQRIAKKKGKYFNAYEPLSFAEGLRLILKSSDRTTLENYKVTKANLPKGLNIRTWYAKDFAYAVEQQIVRQKDTGELLNFPTSKLTRGDVALLLYRHHVAQQIKMESTGAPKEKGMASWYGDGLSKVTVASAPSYVEQFLTAAHRTHPFGTIVKVTNPTNGKWVKVVINDRGPFVEGRVIDLSRTAFSALADPGVGVIEVELEVVTE